uniref:Uncharacterized protein n=1 Tax=Caenorhabditis japonica TaxID=281687 RepID=A0A8R1IXJ6_CAEJA
SSTQINSELTVHFEKTIFHPLEIRGTALRVKNMSNKIIRLTEGETIGSGTIVQMCDLPRPEEPALPVEADWEHQLFDPKDIKFLEKLKIDGPTLTQPMKEKLRDVITQNYRSFFNEDGEIGLFNGGVEHKIELRKDLPFPKSRTYRVPLGNQSEVERFTTDFRLLNAVPFEVTGVTQCNCRGIN